MTNASEAVTNAYNQGVRDGIRRLADSIKGNSTGDVSSLLQDAAHDAVRSPQRVAEALSTGVAALVTPEPLQEAVRQLYAFIVQHLDPEPGPVEEYITDPSAQAAAIEAVGDGNYEIEPDEIEPDEVVASVEEALALLPEPQRSFIEGYIEGREA